VSKKTNSSGSIWTRVPFWFGVVLSIIVIGFGGYSLTQWPICGGIGPCMSNWDQLRFRSSPNEIGDMLAGFAGALAFIWIVVTVLLQAAELREQRGQFEKMADAQQAQAGLMEKQGKIFEDERVQRLEDRAEKQLEARLAELIQEIKSFSEKNTLFCWFTGQRKVSHNHAGRIISESPYDNVQTGDQFCIVLFDQISKKMEGFRAAYEGEVDPPDVYFGGPADVVGIEKVLTLGNELLGLQSELSSDQKIRLRALKLKYSIGEISKLLDRPEEYVVHVGNYQ
jgi:hypothetical protein